jgi:excinuclease ABC subunit B
VQVAGRAARNVNGTVILYGDTVTESMRRAMDEMSRRRKTQEDFNIKNNITPTTVKKAIKEGIEILRKSRELVTEVTGERGRVYLLTTYVSELEEVYGKRLPGTAVRARDMRSGKIKET